MLAGDRPSASVAGRPARLPKRADLLSQTASRRKVATPAFLLQAAPAPTGKDLPAMRVGFTASRKIGNAVARNRARRRLRALAAAILPHGAWPDWDYVLVARREALRRDFAAMGEDLRAALRRLQPGGPPAP